MDFDHDPFMKYPSMKFLFHSVLDIGNKARYYNVYDVGDDRYYAECHHFNRQRACEHDFELQKEGDDWTSPKPGHERDAQLIGEEIDRLYPHKEGS